MQSWRSCTGTCFYEKWIFFAVFFLLQFLLHIASIGKKESPPYSESVKQSHSGRVYLWQCAHIRVSNADCYKLLPPDFLSVFTLYDASDSVCANRLEYPPSPVFTPRRINTNARCDVTSSVSIRFREPDREPSTRWFGLMTTIGWIIDHFFPVKWQREPTKRWNAAWRSEVAFADLGE